jgi:hypothetical protein
MEIDGIMDRLFKTNNYRYNDPFANELACLFSYRGVNIHPDSLSPDKKPAKNP